MIGQRAIVFVILFETGKVNYSVLLQDSFFKSFQIVKENGKIYMQYDFIKNILIIL